ncbi:MAG: helix-turn-helix domain-containing protein [Desulfitobacteriaceae bacterium]
MSEEQVCYGGRTLKKARMQAEIWTQKELARRTGIAACIISDLECGRRIMSPKWALRIAEVIGVEYETLLDDMIPKR